MVGRIALERILLETIYAFCRIAYDLPQGQLPASRRPAVLVVSTSAIDCWLRNYSESAARLATQSPRPTSTANHCQTVAPNWPACLEVAGNKSSDRMLDVQYLVFVNHRSRLDQLQDSGMHENLATWIGSANDGCCCGAASMCRYVFLLAPTSKHAMRMNYFHWATQTKTSQSHLATELLDTAGHDLAMTRLA